MVKAQKTFRHDKSSIHNHHQEDFAAFNEADSSDTQCAKNGKMTMDIAKLAINSQKKTLQKINRKSPPK